MADEKINTLLAELGRESLKLSTAQQALAHEVEALRQDRQTLGRQSLQLATAQQSLRTTESAVGLFRLVSRARKLITNGTSGVVITALTVHPDPWGVDQARFDTPRCYHPAVVDANQWLQFLMPAPVLLVGFITQGRICLDALQWTKQAEVSYSMNGIDFISCGSFSLNTDAKSPSTNLFQKPIWAKSIRFNPTHYEGVGVLKVELLGFTLGDSVILEEVATSS